jgi:hypothetical protein
VVVPQQAAYVVERLGRYAGTLQAGFHVRRSSMSFGIGTHSRRPRSTFLNRFVSLATTCRCVSMGCFT